MLIQTVYLFFHILWKLLLYTILCDARALAPFLFLRNNIKIYIDISTIYVIIEKQTEL
jgi:hypothetical protein